MNGFTPEEMSRGGDAAAAVAAVVAAAAAAASAGNGAGAGAGAEVPGAGAVSAAGPPGAAGPGPGQLCCLREDGERCGRAAGNASFSKRIQKSISQKKARHLYICDYHKNLIQSVRNRRKRKGSDDDGGDSPVQDIDTPEVDLYQLQVNTLRRYKRHFKLSTRPGLNKAQLVELVTQISSNPGLCCAGDHLSGTVSGASCGLCKPLLCAGETARQNKTFIPWIFFNSSLNTLNYANMRISSMAAE
ncbi:histone deacetylase complex subunit SAP30 isoform X2 [Vulpes lagopus]|uniref:histone deacetylase complex subunit SAP30 isoform X2 n=1 Tax=Vulpes lagopus TaxID=494514 RepID=UPI001BC9AAA1|nr:histone deacetylase complex subunit SAP30 isoform X2 [Vulpes lagopus]